MTATQRKAKKCKSCGNEFYPFKTTEVACSVDCAISIARERMWKKHEKQARKDRREYYANHKPTQLGAAQKAFNAYIRKRDAGKPCISCGRNSGAKMNAGHYLSVGAHPELRFEEKNCHLQCEHCNSFLSGNIARYRINLIDKIGLPLVEWLEGPHEPKNYTITEIIEIKDHFKCLNQCMKK